MESLRYAWRRLVVRDPDLSDAVRRVLLELESYADHDGRNARPGVDRIAEALQTPRGRVSERTVRRALEIGVGRGFVECTLKGRRGRNRGSADVYRLTLPPEFAAQLADIQMSGSHEELPDTQMSGSDCAKPVDNSPTTGHPDVHQSPTTTGHLSATTGQISTTTGHPDVHPPETRRPERGYVSTEGHPRAHNPPPTPNCPQHPDGTHTPCRACRDARHTRETWDAEQRQTRIGEARHRAELRAQAIAACPLCDHDGYVGTTLCDHDPDTPNRARRGRAAWEAARALRNRTEGDPCPATAHPPNPPEHASNGTSPTTSPRHLAMTESTGASRPEPETAATSPDCASTVNDSSPS